MDEQQDQVIAIQRPTTDDRDEWNFYWKAQEMPWRTEPEIDVERQRYLAKRRAIVPDTERGIYPFRDESGGIKLSRADVEWLLATEESDGVRGPVNWRDEHQRERSSVDFRGAMLVGTDLSGLPLSHGVFGVGQDSQLFSSEARMAGTHLEGANLSYAHLEQSQLTGAHLEGANLTHAHLEQASLPVAHLEGANLSQARLEGAFLPGAFLGGIEFLPEHLTQIRRWLPHFPARLPGAQMLFAHFDEDSYLRLVDLGDNHSGVARVADVRWNGAELTGIKWKSIKILGDEQEARCRKAEGKKKDWARRETEFEDAILANRQLAIALHAQGDYEPANNFAYRGQVLQRKLFWRRWNFPRYLGSLFLALVSGYGYKPMRSLITYILVICAFAAAYLINAQFAAPHLTWDEALVLSISAFHGRGFFTSGISLGDTLARLAAGEAIIGLLIEITFIATFTQRFFAR